jgi:capsular polysaccharide biosynthesis protein
MPDIFDLIGRWWKQIVLIAIIAVAISATIVFLQPPQYLSVATAVPANAALADKSRIFNENIEALYPGLGGSGELDLVVGTGHLDTVYTTVATAFKLWEHYKIKGENDVILNKAALALRHNTNISKSEFGELKVKVWDTDRDLAAKLANAIVEVLNSIHQGLQNATNIVTLQNLKSQQESLMRPADSVPPHQIEIDGSLRQAKLDQIAKYEKLINEYTTIISTNPRVLIVVDKAKPAERPDRPKRMLTLAATGFLALLFGLVVALILERRKKTAS